ncbi:rhomboid family intramembrane serine protease [Clostridium sp.]|uniref:rhomboid family intramembrane serine protease n=1 Tax=Clostridium sp. TaxID=1506 RepID=UPI002FC6E779
MRGFENNVFNFLTKTQGFYISQYFSKFNDGEKWIAIKDLDDCIYAVIICEDTNEDINLKESFEYLASLGKKFILNSIILVKGDYIRSGNLNYKLIYNINTKEILYCDRSTEPLKACLEVIDKENERERSKNLFKQSPVTMTLILINVIIFLLTAIASKNIIDINGLVLVKYGAKVNYLINEGEIWRLVTCSFLHGGLMHIVFNMYSLFVVGSVVEKIFGVKKYLSIYFVSAITSSALSYFLAPDTISVGASGAIFGVLGAFLLFALKEKEHLQKGVIGNVVAVIALNLYIGITSSNIDNLGHIGGFVGGFLLATLLYRGNYNK